eukprot:g30167.t1
MWFCYLDWSREWSERRSSVDRVCCTILGTCAVHSLSRKQDNVLDAEELGEWEQSSQEEGEDTGEVEALLVHDRAQLRWVLHTRQELTATWFRWLRAGS